MSEYTPLTQNDEDCDPKGNYHISPFSSDRDQVAAFGAFKHGSPKRGVIYCTVVLLFVNVLVWAVAAVQAIRIFDNIQKALDIVDTRALRRPDTWNGLEMLYKGAEDL